LSNKSSIIDKSKLINKDPRKITSYAIFGSIISQLLNIPNKLIAASILAPSGFGILTMINLIFRYSNFGLLGFTKTLARNIPILYGSNQLSKIQDLKANVLGSSIILLFINLLILYLLYYFDQLNIINNNFLIIIISLIIIFDRFGSYLKGYAKGENLLEEAAKLDFIIKVVSPIVFIIGVITYGLNGIIISFLLISILNALLYKSLLKDYVFKIIFHFSKMVQIGKIGIPLFLNGLLETILLTINIILISKYLGVESVGIFGFGTSIMFAKKIPFASGINNILSRRILVDFGKYGKSKIQVYKDYFQKYQIIYIFFHALFLGFIYLLLCYLVPIFLADFKESLIIMQYIMFGYIIYAGISLNKFFLNATKEFKVIGYITLLGIIINSVGSFYLIINDYKLITFSLVLSFSFLVTSTIFIITVNNRIKINLSNTILYIIKIIFCSLICTLAISFIAKTIKIDFYYINDFYAGLIFAFKTLMAFIIKSSFFAFFSLLIFQLFFPGQKLFSNIKKMITTYSPN